MILAGERLHAAPIRCGGLLVIGDPHVGSRRPGRRKDADWPSPVLAKLERCVAIANERDLVPVILGDLFDRASEPDEALKARLIRLFKQFRHRPIANVGNHDIEHTMLSDGDSLAVLGLCDVVDVVALSAPVCEVDVGGRRLGLGMTPFGQDVPRALNGAFPGAEATLWFTHHDIAFEGSYPRAVPPFVIEGCQTVINGHIHKTQKPVTVGRTRWLNPGNITRQSVDLVDHLPRAWIFGAEGELEPHPLPHTPDVFDLTGRLVDAADADDVAGAVESAFVSLLRAETPTSLARSDDGSILRDEIEAKFERDGTSDAVQAIVRSLLGEAVQRRETGR